MKDSQKSNRHDISFSRTASSDPQTMDTMTDAELDAMLQHSYAQSVVGEGRLFGDVFDDLERSVVIGELTKEQFDAEMQQGMDDIADGRIISADDVETEMRKLYGA